MPGVRGKLEEAPGVALFDLARRRLAAGKAEAAGEVRDLPGARQLEERERVAAALRDDLVADRGVQRAADVVQQQRARVGVAEPLEGQLGESGEDLVADARARGAHDRDPLGEEPAGDEAEDLHGGVVEPLRVVDDADERLLLGDLGQQRQGGEPDHEPVGRGAGAPAEHGRERVALRGGEPVEVIEHGGAELVEAAVGQLDLRLDADGPRNAPAADAVGQVAQQRALAHARLPAQDDDPAPTGERIGQELVERLALGATSEEPRGARTSQRPNRSAVYQRPGSR